MTPPTYKQVCDAMERFVLDKSKPGEFRGRVFGWMSEYSERNHARMFEVVTKLKQIELEYHHPDFDIPESKKSFSVLLRYLQRGWIYCTALHCVEFH